MSKKLLNLIVEISKSDPSCIDLIASVPSIKAKDEPNYLKSNKFSLGEDGSDETHKEYFYNLDDEKDWIYQNYIICIEEVIKNKKKYEWMIHTSNDKFYYTGIKSRYKLKGYSSAYFNKLITYCKQDNLKELLTFI